MNQKIETILDYINSLSESELDQIISFILGIVSENQQLSDSLLGVSQKKCWF